MKIMRSPAGLGLWLLTLLITPAIVSAQTGAAGAPGALSGEVLIEADLFGVGGVVRPADFAGIRLVLTDRGDRVRDAVVRLNLRDPDGDTINIQRPITLNPGRTQPLWMYAMLPPGFDRSSLMSVSVHESFERADGIEAGRQIASGAVAPSRVAGIEETLIGVVGRNAGGLEQYSVRDDSGTPAPTSHETIVVVTGIEPAGMPDSWLGLAAFDTIAWLDGDPSALRADQADAIREWVRRGGRLIVALPAVGQLWTTGANPLLDIMPAMFVTRREGVDLDSHRRLLTYRDSIPLPANMTVHTFAPAPNARSHEAMAVLAGPDGEAVAMRRLVGLGDVTVLGIDPSSSRLVGRIDAQMLWHRLLGHRFEVRTRAEITAETRQNNFNRPSTVVVDTGVAGLINKTGSAGVGVLLGLLVFAAYFLLAGPIGFAALNRLGARRHAWLAFVGVSFAFTVIAWGGATILRPRTTDLTHLSIVDSVHGEDTTRVRSWFSVLLPTYGSQVVSLETLPAGRLSDPRNTLWAWREPGPGVRASFPDQRAYSIDTRRPDSARVPTRSTVKEFEARWIGPAPLRMPRPVGAEITLDESASLVGSIVHELPAPLERVVVLLNRGQQPLVVPRDGGPLTANAWAWSPFGSGAWAPGVPLNLAALDYRSADTGEQYFAGATRSVTALTAALEGALTRTERALDAITWFGSLSPPDWRRAVGVTAARRSITHGLDLSRWMSQPCLIVIGQLPESAVPAPVLVDGVAPPSNGRTLVRWVYPLPPDPPQPTRETF